MYHYWKSSGEIWMKMMIWITWTTTDNRRQQSWVEFFANSSTRFCLIWCFCDDKKKIFATIQKVETGIFIFFFRCETDTERQREKKSAQFRKRAIKISVLLYTLIEKQFQKVEAKTHKWTNVKRNQVIINLK